MVLSKWSNDELASTDWDLTYYRLCDMDAGIARQRLLDKLAQSVRAYIATIVRSRLNDIPEVEDIIQDIQSSLIQVWSKRTQIENMKGYVRKASFNRCDEHLHSKYPNYFSCADRVEYRLTTRLEFALWKVGGKNWGGLSEWQPPAPAGILPNNARLEQLMQSPYQTLSTSAAFRDKDVRHIRNADAVLYAVFRHVGHAVLMKHLVPLFQELWNLRDYQEKELPQDDLQMSVEDNSPLTQLIAQEDMKSDPQRLWEQVKALPLCFRCVILLHRKLAAPDLPLIHALMLYGIASRAEIADVLELAPDALAIAAMNLPLEQLADMLDMPTALLKKFSPEERELEIVKVAPQELKVEGVSLPLDYRQIGELLGCTAGRVANLNQDALKLLARKRRADNGGGQN